MQTPKYKVERVAQLGPGELFLAELRGVHFVGLVCSYDGPGSNKPILPLGPRFPDGNDGPTLLDVHLTAVSFGSEFVIRFPVDPEQWMESEPARDCQCLLAIENNLYFRANGSPDPGALTYYVNAVTGVVEVMPGVPPGRPMKPSGTGAYALAWEIVTTEPKPRVILKYPFPDTAPVAA